MVIKVKFTIWEKERVRAELWPKQGRLQAERHYHCKKGNIGWVSQGGGGSNLEKRWRFERQKEKAVLIFTDSQSFLNILLLPAV